MAKGMKRTERKKIKKAKRALQKGIPWRFGRFMSKHLQLLKYADRERQDVVWMKKEVEAKKVAQTILAPFLHPRLVYSKTWDRQYSERPSDSADQPWEWKLMGITVTANKVYERWNGRRAAEGGRMAFVQYDTAWGTVWTLNDVTYKLSSVTVTDDKVYEEWRVAFIRCPRCGTEQL